MSKSNLVVLLDAKHPEAAAQAHETADTAFAFLKEASRIKANMAHFTTHWTKLRPKRLRDKAVKDRDVLKGLAGLMAEGKLRLKQAVTGGAVSDDNDAPAYDPAPRRPAKTWRGGPTVRERPDPKPASPPPRPMDVAKQVDALLAAAKSGAPFVEQCKQ